MSKFIAVQISPRKFAVAEGAMEGSVYRTICTLDSEYNAKKLRDKLNEPAVQK